MEHEEPQCTLCPYDWVERFCRKEHGKAPRNCPTARHADLIRESKAEACTGEFRAMVREATIREGAGYSGKERGYRAVCPSKPRILEGVCPPGREARISDRLQTRGPAPNPSCKHYPGSFSCTVENGLGRCRRIHCSRSEPFSGTDPHPRVSDGNRGREASTAGFHSAGMCPDRTLKGAQSGKASRSRLLPQTVHPWYTDSVSSIHPWRPSGLPYQQRQPVCGP